MVAVVIEVTEANSLSTPTPRLDVRALSGEASQQVLGATRSAMIRTPEEVLDRYVPALSYGSLDGLIRVRTVDYAL
jgi:hypothetical protein